MSRWHSGHKQVAAILLWEKLCGVYTKELHNEFMQKVTNPPACKEHAGGIFYLMLYVWNCSE